MRVAQAGFTNTAQTGLVCPALHQIPMLPRRMEGAETLTCFCTPIFDFFSFVFTLLIWLIGYIAQRINERSIT